MRSIRGISTRRRLGEILRAKGFEVFLPLYESTRKWKDRRKLLSLPLFPGYVFVRGAHERRLPVLTTPGVHMIISRRGASCDGARRGDRGNSQDR